ncbi:MAG: YitT family protein [Clostridia bacterium]|nr:YitT family protein [Clostridia bacterium]
MVKMKIGQIIVDFAVIIVAAVLSAVGLYTFVNPANFAPSGIDGIALMSQQLFGINMGYVSLAINIPLLVMAWFYINKKYVVYTFVFTVMSSVMLIVMENMNMYEYVSENNTWIAVFASGILLGTRTALMIKLGGSSGGVDIIASVFQKKKPYLNIEVLISLFCYIIIGMSFFVYHNIESIIMSIVQMLIFNLAMNYILKTTRNAVEVKIITDEPEKFREDILTNLKHGATVIKCTGMYTGDEKAMIVTLINMKQMNDLIKLSKKYSNTFLYFGDATGVWGNFRWNKTDEVK